MNGTHITLCIPGASASLAVQAAELVERWALDGYWVGDPRATAPNRDDNYVMTTLAGIAAATSDIRLGAVLSLPETSTPLRIAEDIGVVDTASGGRLELALLASGDPGWEGRATSLLEAFHLVPLPDGRSVSVHPKPHQPWLPRVVFGGPEAADRLGAGEGLFPDDPVRPSSIVRQRRLLVLEPFAESVCVRDALAADPVEVVRRMRAAIDAVTAHQIVLILPLRPGSLADDVHVIGTVVATGLRCAGFEAAVLTADAWRWLTERAALHEYVR